MALIRWEPVPVNRFFNSFFDTPTVAPAQGLRRWTPAVDVIENDTDYTLRADLPGLSDKDIAIEVEDNVLTVSGERRSEHEQRAGGYCGSSAARERFAARCDCPRASTPSRSPLASRTACSR